MSSSDVVSSQARDSKRGRLLRVCDDQLKVEEKLQVLDALLSACDQRRNLTNVCSKGDGAKACRQKDVGENNFYTNANSHCTLCGKNYKKLAQYYGHLKAHRKNGSQWVCSECPGEVTAFKSLSFLRRHEKFHHTESQISKSKGCQDMFFHSSLLKPHQSSNVLCEQTQFACQICKKGFFKRSDLRSHLACHLSLQVNICEVCGRSFSHTSNLIRHLRVHSGAKPYPCNLCGRRFSQVSSLNQHKSCRHSSQSILYPVSPDALIKDTHSQRKRRRFFCRICGEVFQLMQDMKTHFLEHMEMGVVSFKDKESAGTKISSSSAKLPLKTGVLVEGQLDFDIFSTTSKLMLGSGLIETENIKNTSDPVKEACKIVESLENLGSTGKGYNLEDNYNLTRKCVTLAVTEQKSIENFKFNNNRLDSIQCIRSSLKPSETSFKTVSTGLEKTEWNLYSGSSTISKVAHIDSPNDIENEEYKNMEFKVNKMSTLVESTSDPEETFQNFMNHSILTPESKIRVSGQQDDKPVMEVLQPFTQDLGCQKVTYDVILGISSDSVPDILNEEILMTDRANTSEMLASKKIYEFSSFNVPQNKNNDGMTELQFSSVNHSSVFYQNIKLLHSDYTGETLGENGETKGKKNENNGKQMAGIETNADQETSGNSETFMLSFGESYSALLKDIGITQDDTTIGEYETVVDNPIGLDMNKNVQTAVSSVLDRYSILLEDTIDHGFEDMLNTQAGSLQHDAPKQCTDGMLESTISYLPLNFELKDNISTVLESSQYNLNCNDQTNNSEKFENFSNANLSFESISSSNSMFIFVPEGSTAQAEIIKPSKEKEIDSSLVPASHMTANPLLLTSAKWSVLQSSYDDCQNIGERLTKIGHPVVHYMTPNNDLELISSKDSTKTQSKPVRKVFSKQSQDDVLDTSSHSTKKTLHRLNKQCLECGKVFSKSSNLHQHLGLHYPQMKLYKCTVCYQTFSWKSSLNKHMNTHALSTQQFLCDVCGNQYKSFNQVQQHKKRDHQGLRPNICGICSKSFFRKYDLLIHERIHTNEKPFMCDTCGKIFNHLSHLKRHKNAKCEPRKMHDSGC